MQVDPRGSGHVNASKVGGTMLTQCLDAGRVCTRVRGAGGHR